jgi:nucleotide-binding universal stress UspA family protein
MDTTLAHERVGDPAAADAPGRRILIAIHGYEPDGWLRALRGAVRVSGLVRVLVVDDTPAPACTALLPAARRRRDAALRAWRREAEPQARTALDALAAELPALPEVVRLDSGGDPGRTIAAHARDWPADLVVLGRDARGRLARALLGTVHERAAARAGCAVLVMQAAPRWRPRTDAPGAALPSPGPVPGGA